MKDRQEPTQAAVSPLEPQWTHEAKAQKPFNDEITNIKEMGATKNGERQVLDERLFMQLQAFGGIKDPAPLINILKKYNIASVLYVDINDPQGIALLAMNDDPAFFCDNPKRDSSSR